MACQPKAVTPRFAYTALDGRRRQSTDLLGDVVLVSFWATSCAICIEEMPQLVALHRRFAGPGFRTLAVAMAYDAPARVAAFAESRQLPFEVVIDNTGDIARAFEGVRATPTTALLDAKGGLSWRSEGKASVTQLAARIQSLLNASPAS